LLAGEPSGNWEGGIRALAQRGARVSAVAFASTGVLSDETLKKIATQLGGALRLNLFDDETAKKAFSWVGKLLQQSVESMGPASIAGSHADSPPPGAQVTAGPAFDLVLHATKQPEVRKAQVLVEDKTLPSASETEPASADSQERLTEETASDTDTKENMQSEDVSVGTTTPEQPEAAPSVDEAMDEKEEVAPAYEDAPVETVEPEPEPPPVTKDGVATIWEDREPTDPSDPVKHTDARLLEAPDSWRIVGASRRGKMHAHKGIYREDAFAFGETNGWHLVVVADGGGSCPLSRVGSQLAADTAVATMARLASTMKSDDRTIAKEICEIALRRSAEDAWKALQKAAQERNRSMKDLGTTFLAMMHHLDEAGHIIGVLQVGDGLVTAEMADGSIKVLAEPDVGETAGVTLFLTSKPWKEWVDRAVVHTLDTLKSPLKLLTAMCDGVADDFIPLEQHLRKLFDALDNVTKHEQPEQQLLDLLAYDKRGSFDDRTLVMIYPAQDMPDRRAEVEEAEHASIPSSTASDSPAPTSSDTVEEDEGSDGDVA